VLDEPHKDLRRARACGMSLIPTTTGSATAITEIFPELKGRLNGHAVRVPLANASLTDCVFEVERPTTAEEVNAAAEGAAEGRLSGILGYEERRWCRWITDRPALQHHRRAVHHGDQRHPGEDLRVV
jgi:glyceraldehyde 3-phosphate dehydrogenase